MKKQEFMDLLKKLHLNKKEFAKIASVPYPTVNSWGATRKGVTLEIPNWVREFLFYYEKARKLDILTEEICSKLSKL